MFVQYLVVNIGRHADERVTRLTKSSVEEELKAWRMVRVNNSDTNQWAIVRVHPWT